jgi:hypothetical protein
MRGGKRNKAGRPSKPPGTLAKDLKPVRGIRLTDTEYAAVKAYIKHIRAQEQKGPGSEEDNMNNKFNGCRAYAKEWAKGLGSNHTTRTRKTENGYVSHIFFGNDLVGKLEFSADGSTEWSEWQDGSGYSYTQSIDRWY